jgi:hydroxypyruvate reductase
MSAAGASPRPDHAALAADIVRRTLALADAEHAVRRHAQTLASDLASVESITLIGVGKAAAGMVRGAGATLGPRIADGVVIVPRDASGRAADPGPLPAGVERLRADHPTPSPLSLAAGARVEALVRGASRTAGRAVVLLISGGASALMAAPRAGLTLDDLARVAEALMKAGAGIGEVNTVRRRLDRLKGGGLLRLAAPAPVFTYAISDVHADDLRTIGSGPGVPDTTTDADALAVLAARGALTTSPAAHAVLRAGIAHEPDDAPGGQHAGATPLHLARVLLSNTRVVEALAQGLADIGDVIEVHAGVRGEARAAAWSMVQRLRAAAAALTRRLDRPRIIVWGGETTVTVRGRGVGGRNQEFALAAALASADLARLPGLPLRPPEILVMSFGTDGVDGVTDAAGAFVTDHTPVLCGTLGLDARAALDANDSHSLLAALQRRGQACLLATGPTGTNVNDVMLGMVWGS